MQCNVQRQTPVRDPSAPTYEGFRGSFESWTAIGGSWLRLPYIATAMVTRQHPLKRVLVRGIDARGLLDGRVRILARGGFCFHLQPSTHKNLHVRRME